MKLSRAVIVMVLMSLMVTAILAFRPERTIDAQYCDNRPHKSNKEYVECRKAIRELGYVKDGINV